MTAKNFGMMVIGMMILGTTTVFGKTNTTVHNDRHNNVRTEVVVINNHNNGRMVAHHHMDHHMDRFMVKHILDGRHMFNRYGECNVCHMNRHEIRKAEHELRHNHVAPRPMMKTSHFVH